MPHVTKYRKGSVGSDKEEVEPYIFLCSPYTQIDLITEQTALRRYTNEKEIKKLKAGGSGVIFGICSANAATPHVVAEPATSMFSFTVNGTPASGPSDFRADTARSTTAAAWR